MAAMKGSAGRAAPQLPALLLLALSRPTFRLLTGLTDFLLFDSRDETVPGAR